MWIILIIIIFIISIYLSIKLNFKNYSLDFKKIIKEDKSGLFLSLASKIGVGSIIGTVSSIIIGGFSSVIWMIIFTLITTSIIYYESYYGNKYKENNISGPYFIIKNGLNNKKLSIISLILIIILYSFLFQMIQVNTITNIINYSLFIDKKIIIILIILLLLLTTSLNIKETKNIINRIVPIKCIIFIFFCLIGIINHFKELFLCNIELFNYKSIISGLVIGVKRSIFMNEILIGTTSISSGSDNNDIETSIKYQILGVLFITFIIMIMIALLTLIYLNSHSIINDYNSLIVSIFLYTNNKIGVYFILIILLLFGLTTLLSGYYILISNIEYIFNNRKIVYFFKILFIIGVSVGSLVNNYYLWKYTDIIIFISIIINSYCIIKLSRRKI